MALLDLPNERSVNSPFKPQYARAREIGYFAMADEILEIADDSRNDGFEQQNADGTTQRRVDHDRIARSRLRVDTRKWMLARALPKVFGDKAEGTDKPDTSWEEMLHALDTRCPAPMEG
jgi:hypothetical protein